VSEPQPLGAVSADEARSRSQIVGEAEWAAPFFDAVAVMA
jgi:hypothetical protein